MIRRGAACIGTIILAASGAQAFNCSLPEGPKAPYYLHDKPNDKSKVIAVMPAGGHIRMVGKGRHVGGSPQGAQLWTYVQWTPEDPKARRLRGWIDREKTHGGECED